MIQYLNINWEKDLSLVNTHLYFNNLDHKLKVIRYFEESGRDYNAEI